MDNLSNPHFLLPFCFENISLARLKSRVSTFFSASPLLWKTLYTVRCISRFQILAEAVFSSFPQPIPEKAPFTFPQKFEFSVIFPCSARKTAVLDGRIPDEGSAQTDSSAAFRQFSAFFPQDPPKSAHHRVCIGTRVCTAKMVLQAHIFRFASEKRGRAADPISFSTVSPAPTANTSIYYILYICPVCLSRERDRRQQAQSSAPFGCTFPRTADVTIPKIIRKAS